jgi:hypothetical protein
MGMKIANVKQNLFGTVCAVIKTVLDLMLFWPSLI